jgi:hypothetical protein
MIRSIPDNSRIVRGTFGVTGISFDWSSLACDTLGGFRITTNVKCNSSAGRQLSGRINGSNTTNITWTSTNRLGYNVILGYSGLDFRTGDWMRVVIECLYPSSSLGGIRNVSFTAFEWRPSTGASTTGTLIGTYTASDEITGVGVEMNYAVDLLDETSHYTIERLP